MKTLANTFTEEVGHVARRLPISSQLGTRQAGGGCGSGVTVLTDSSRTWTAHPQMRASLRSDSQSLKAWRRWPGGCGAPQEPWARARPGQGRRRGRGRLISRRPRRWRSKHPSASVGEVGHQGLIAGLGRHPGVGNCSWLRYSCLAVPRTEEPGGQRSVGSQWDTTAPLRCTQARAEHRAASLLEKVLLEAEGVMVPGEPRRRWGRDVDAGVGASSGLFTLGGEEEAGTG